MTDRYTELVKEGVQGALADQSGRPRGALVINEVKFLGFIAQNPSGSGEVHAQILQHLTSNPFVSARIDILGSPERLTQSQTPGNAGTYDPAGLDPEVGESARWLPEDVLILNTLYGLSDAGQGERVFRMRGELIQASSKSVIWSNGVEHREIWDCERGIWVSANW